MVERTERVVLELVDRFSGPMARAAAATETTSRALHDLDGSSTSAARSQDNLNRSTTRTTQTLRRSSADVDRVSSSFRRGGADIDSYSGRLGLLATAAVSLGPALVPIAASALPAVSGLAAGLGAAAGAAGVAALAFHGVGDALKAVDAYQLDPTAENLAKMRQEMQQVGPATAQFVRYLDQLEGPLSDLRQTAAAGLFPGLEDGINQLMGGLPAVKDLVGDLATEMGNLASDAGDALAHDEDWSRFFSYIKSDAVPTLDTFARAAGNVAAGLADLLTDFAPLSRSFNSGLLDMSRNFRAWADNLGNTKGFREFIDYIRQSGPQVLAFLSALGDAFVGLVRAMAPWGNAVLPLLTSTAKVFATIADSPIGPVLYDAAAAMLVFGRASRVFTTVGTSVSATRTSFRQLRTDLASMRGEYSRMGPASAIVTSGLSNTTAAAGRVREQLGRLGGAAKAAAGIGGMMLLSDAATQTNKSVQVLEDAAGGAAAGFAVGGPWGAAIGGATGLLLSFADSNEKAAQASGDLLATLDKQSGAFKETSAKWVTSQLTDDDIKQFNELGISMNDVADAALHGGDAMSKLAQEVQRGVVNKWGSDEVWNQLPAWEHLQKITGDVTATQRQFTAQTETTSAALDGETDSTDRAAEAARTAAASLKSYIDQQNQLHQATLANIDKQTAFGQALHDAQVQASKGTKGFSAFTEAGRENRNAMSQLIGAYNDQSQAVKNSVKGYRDVKAEVTNLGHQMHLSKAQIDALTDAIDKPKTLEIRDEEAQQKVKAIQRLVNTYGLTKAQATALLDDNASGKIRSVQQLVDKYGLSRKTATALLNDLASGKLRSIQELINSLHDKTVTVRLNHITENSVITHYSNTFSGSSNNPPNRTPGAMGMILRGDRKVFARGGVDRANAHEAEIAAGATPYRVWAEPETQGEAYIPFANDHRRPRARRILEYTADQLGGDVTWHANGGIVQRFASGGYAHASSGTHNALTPAERRDQRLIDAIKRVGDRADRLTKSVDKARNRVDAWTDKQDQLASTIRSSLTLDAFGGSTSWNDTNRAGSLGSWRATERTQRTNAQALAKDIATLRRDGASDEFISYILSQSDPASVAHMFASETKAQVRSDQSLYASATRAVSTTANAGGAIYNNEIRESNQQLAHVRAELKQANQHLKQLRAEEKKAHNEAQEQRKKQPHETAKAISKPAAKGKRDAR